MALTNGTVLIWDLDRLIKGKLGNGKKMIKLVQDVHYK